MKILVIGGTQFIGRHVVNALMQTGHSVTLLNRGKTAPGLFPDLPLIRADRSSDEILANKNIQKNWDAVVDLCAFYPKDVAQILGVLRGRAGRYVLFSSLSAYLAAAIDGPIPIIDESSPLQPCSPEEAVDATLASYGQRKAECERVAMKQHADGVPVVVLRPALVYGAHDHTDRMAHWFWRAARNRPFLLPDDGLTVTGRTYAPDLATACLSAIRKPAALGNAYNIGETDPPSFRDTMHWLGVHLGTKPLEHAVSIPGARLVADGVRQWVDLPSWISQTNLLMDCFRSRRDLEFVSTPSARALADAADAFLAEGREPKAGLSPNTEAEILARLKV